MTDKPLVEVDPLTGGITEYSYDESAEAVITKSTTNVGPILEIAKEMQNDGTQGWVSSRKEMRLAAVIPPEVVELWHQKYGIDFYNKDHKPAIKRLLNSSDWRWLRTNNSHL